jgi:hypothetical protein
MKRLLPTLLVALGFLIAPLTPASAASLYCHPYGDGAVYGYSSFYYSGVNREYFTRATKSTINYVWSGNEQWTLIGVYVDENSWGGYTAYYPASAFPHRQLLSNRTHAFSYVWRVSSFWDTSDRWCSIQN